MRPLEDALDLKQSFCKGHKKLSTNSLELKLSFVQVYSIFPIIKLVALDSKRKKKKKPLSLSKKLFLLDELEIDSCWWLQTLTHTTLQLPFMICQIQIVICLLFSLFLTLVSLLRWKKHYINNEINVASLQTFFFAIVSGLV